MQEELTRNDIQEDYFNWMYSMMCDGRFAESISYKMLFKKLMRTEFTWKIDMDENRAGDGIELRHIFILQCNYPEYYETYLDGPCSVLEMIVALAIRIERDIMDNPDKGDRTTQWFWMMLNNLGISSMDDDYYDEKSVSNRIRRFLNREYSRNGKGGLFFIRNCEEDLTTVEIWYQMCWYLDTIIS